MSQGKKRSSQKAPARKESNPLVRALIVLFGAIAVALTGYLVWSLASGGTNAGTPNVTPEVTGAPKLKADREKIDLGDVKLGSTVQTAFELTNVGDQALKITGEPFVEVVEGC